MKFAQYLDRNAVEEWRKAYINYRGLKKLIKRVAQHHRDRLELLIAVSESSTPGSSASQSHGATATTTKNQPESLSDLRDRVLESQVGQGAAGDLAAVPPPPHEVAAISLEGTGIKLSKSVSARFTSAGGKVKRGKAPEVPGQTNTSNEIDGAVIDKAGQDRDVENEAEAAGSSSLTPKLTSAERRGAAIKWQQDHEQGNPEPDSRLAPNRKGGSRSDNASDATKKNSSASSLRSFGSAKNKKKKQKKKNKQHEMNCDEYINSIFDPSERIFFVALDSELERITDFYEERLGEAQNRFEDLVAQLRELAAHRRLYKESRTGTTTAERFGFGWHNQLPLTPRDLPKALKGDDSQDRGRRDSRIGRRDFHRKEDAGDDEVENDDFHRDSSPDASDDDEGARRRVRALQKMEALTAAEENERGASRRGDRELASGHAGATGLSYDPVRYKAARHKLKEAITEFYRGLELLRTYKVLNKDGFGKILKKFDKTLDTQTSYQYFQARVEESVLVKSQRVEALLRSTEDAFTGFFEHGDRKKALDRLRMQSGNHNRLRTHHASTATTGICLGISLCAVVGGLVEAMKDHTQARIPSYEALLRVYGALFLPVLFALLFGLNLAAFAHSRINALFIFEWDPRHALDYHQYFEMPAFLMLLLSVAFWVSFVNPFPAAIAPTTWPLVWLVVALVFLFFPLPIFHPRSRSWFLKSFLRVFGFGFLCKGSVEFRDFFLGDELNSIAWSLSSLWFFGCEYQRDWKTPSCDPNGTYWTAVLSSIPALLRLGQCLRRYIDSKFYARIHLLNAAKYSTSVFFYFFYIHWRIHGSQKDGNLALWLYFACMMSSFTMAWDILMDWSLFHTNARWPLLRNELVFESVWPVYYWAIFSNIILRCSWIIYLLPGPASTTMRTFTIALLEILRRWQWNFFRVGNEHQGNVDQYRALRDTPLPYYIPKASSSEDDVVAGDKQGEDKQAGRMSSNGFADRLRLRSRKTQWDVEHDDHPAFGGPELKAGQEQQFSNASQGMPQRPSLAHTQSIPDRGGQSTGQDHSANFPAGTSDPTPSAARAGFARTHMPKRSDTVLGRMQLFLVPDRGGLSARGPRLDEQSAAKGAMGRDYAPRAVEADGLEDDEDDDLEDDDDDSDDDDEGDDEREEDHQASFGSNAGSPSNHPHPHHRRKQPSRRNDSRSHGTRDRSSPQQFGYGSASTSVPIAIRAQDQISNATTGQLTSYTANDEQEANQLRRHPSIWEDEDGDLNSRYRTSAELRDGAAARSLSKSWSRK
ncbi:unnamed protein product [Sympodiomycopsis kandeliae]